MRCWLFNTSEAICPHAMLGFPSRGWAQSLLCYDYISCLVLYHSPLTNHQSPLRWLECLNSHVVVFPPLHLSYYFLWSEAPLLLVFFGFLTRDCLTRDCLMSSLIHMVSSEPVVHVWWCNKGNPLSHSSLKIRSVFSFNFACFLWW